MDIIRKFRLILDRNTKVKLIVLLAAIIVGALLETVALSIVSPFISILLDDSMIESNQYLKFIYDLLGFSSTTAFLALFAFMLAGVYIFRGVYLTVLSKVQHRFIARRQANLSGRLLHKIIDFSYLYHASKNIAELQRIIIEDVNHMFTLLTAALILSADLFMTSFIIIFLLVVSPLMTLCVIMMSILCVLLFFRVFRSKIHMAGKISRNAQIGMYKAVNQALGGIKEVKVLCRKEHFLRAFNACSNVFVKSLTQYRALDAIPKLMVESVCFGGSFILIGALFIRGLDVSSLVPQLSVFVLAAFRLLPSVSRQVNQINIMIYNRSSVDAVYKSLFKETDDFVSPPPPVCEIPLKSRDIIVQNLSFQYPNTNTPVLKNVSIVIPEKKAVAFVGSSGSGKTTLSDLVLGILTPNSGYVFYDGKSVHHSIDRWSHCVGYIPQQIYLLDESIIENVAFGIDRAEIDEAKFWRALEQAQLREFVESLPDGLETIVGDRGIRLSGGQRQRLGIARAMYGDPPILILDEATSALDYETEKAVMSAVMGFQGNKTIIIVAHRLSTIENCDIVYRIEHGTAIRER